MIVDESNSLAVLVNEYKSVRENSVHLARFEKVRDGLSVGVTRIGPLVAAFRTLRDTKISVCNHGLIATDLIATLAQARKAFVERAESLIDTKVFDLARFSKRIETLAKDLEEQLRSDWLRYAQGRIPATRREVLDVLATAFPAEVLLLRQCAEKLELACKDLPITQSAISEFETDVKALQDAWAQVGGGDVPVAVTSFLQAAASPSGASLDLFSDDVRSWLSNHKILTSFSIKVSN